MISISKERLKKLTGLLQNREAFLEFSKLLEELVLIAERDYTDLSKLSLLDTTFISKALDCKGRFTAFSELQLYIVNRLNDPKVLKDLLVIDDK